MEMLIEKYSKKVSWKKNKKIEEWLNKGEDFKDWWWKIMREEKVEENKESDKLESI